MHQALQSVLTPLFSNRSRDSIRVCAIKSDCLVLQLAHSAMLFELRGQLPSLLAAARTVNRSIVRIDFVVRPLSALPILPEQDYQMRRCSGTPGKLSSGPVSNWWH